MKSLLLIAVIILELMISPAPAQISATWNGGSGDWATGGNWTGGSSPGSITGTTNGDSAFFGNGSGTVTVDANRNILDIHFDGYAAEDTLSGGSLLLSADGEISFDGNSQNANYAGLAAEVNMPITLQGAASFDNTSNYEILDFGTSASLTNSTASTLTLDGTNTVITTGGFNTIAGNISDGGGTMTLFKQGTNVWTLSGANSYSGTTTVSAGGLDFLNEVSLYGGNISQWTTSNIIVNNGATLAVGVGGTGQFTAADISTLLGVAATNGGFESGSSLGLDTSDATGGNFTYSASISNLNGGNNTLGITKYGEQTLTLSGNNTYTGMTNLNEGTLNVGSTGALGGGGSIIFTGGTLQYSAVNALDYSGRIVDSTSEILIDTNGQNVIFGSPIAASNSFGLWKLGAGTLTLTAESLYTGATLVEAGELDLDNAENPSLSGNLQVNGGTAKFLQSNQLGGTGNLISYGGTIDIGATNQTVATVDVDGGAIIGTTGMITSTSSTLGYILVTGSDSAMLGGSTNAWKQGAGTVTLSGADSYSGTTTLSAGTLQFAKEVSLYDDATGSWNATNIIVDSGATLAVNVGGTGEFTSTDIGLLLALGTATGGFESGSSIGLDTTNASGGNFTYSGSIANPNGGVNVLGLTKLGANTLTLSGSNTYTGPTVTLAGTLQLDNRLSLYDGSTSKWTAANITVASGAILALNVGGAGQFTASDVGTLAALGTSSGGFENGAILGLDTTNANGGNFTYSGSIANPNGGANVLGLAKLGANTLTLSGSNTYTGPVAIDAGTLSIASVATGSTAQALGEGNTVTLGIDGGSAGTLLYTGGLGTLDKNITAIGNGTIQNSGYNVLTLSGTLTKSDTVLTLNGGYSGIVVSGQITGGTSSNFNSDLDIVGGLTTLSNAGNNYTGPTYVYGAGTLKNGVANALPTGTVLILGNATDGAATNTYSLNGFNQTIGALDSVSNAGDTNVDTVMNGASSFGVNTLTLTGINSDGTSVSSLFGGTIQDGGSATTALAITGGTHTFTGSNSYSGGTTLSGGTLLANNKTGSATGSGNVTINSGGTLGGSGTIAPGFNNSIVVASGGNITPGATPAGSVAQGFLTVNSASFTAALTLQTPTGASGSMAQLAFNLGSGTAPTDGSGLIFAGSSSYINLTNSFSGEVQFNNNLIQINDLTNGGLSLNGDYLLFQSSSDFNYAGLTVNSNGEITAGLTLIDAAGASYGSSNLYLQNGDIYVNIEAVPEPSTWALLTEGAIFLLGLRYVCNCRVGITEAKPKIGQD